MQTYIESKGSRRKMIEVVRPNNSANIQPNSKNKHMRSRVHMTCTNIRWGNHRGNKVELNPNTCNVQHPDLVLILFDGSHPYIPLHFS